MNRYRIFKRGDFLAWIRGKRIWRNKKGEVHTEMSRVLRDTKRFLKNGGIVHLLDVNNKPFTQITLDEKTGKYMEHLIMETF